MLYEKLLDEVKVFNCNQLHTSIYDHPSEFGLQAHNVQNTLNVVNVGIPPVQAAAAGVQIGYAMHEIARCSAASASAATARLFRVLVLAAHTLCDILHLHVHL